MKKPRPTSAVLWFCGCSGCFKTTQGNVTVAAHGAVVYIPEGEQYEVQFSDCTGQPSTVLLEFNLIAETHLVLNGGIRVIGMDFGDGRIAQLLKKIAFEYSVPSKSQLKLKRDTYDILALICEIEKYKHIDRRGFKIIEKGIEHLQKDENQQLSIDEIAGMCFVTPAYFRKLFKAYSGYSPSEYRTRQKMERAKDLMEHADLSVEELSDLLAYNDPAYFCRVFKKIVGVSPSQYQKNIRNDF